MRETKTVKESSGKVEQGQVESVEASQEGTRSRPERLEWFQELGLGLFIHWSLDSELGCVISHSLVGASNEYVQRFIRDLPRWFCPRKFDPGSWAALARTAGVRYVVFTTKHHSGFCMFETETTDFSVMNTPYGEDITRQVVDAFREKGISIGLYFSPDDFYFLHRQGRIISRRRREALPSNNPELMEHNLRQLRELLTNYGPVDILFLDGDPNGLRELAWELAPYIVVTRGGLATPEQHLPDEAPSGPWEACFTMGTQWHYRPTNETYKSGRRLIEMLIETRAKGGNLLINVGPTPDGEIPFEQSRRLRELGLWMFINGEAVYGTVPWHVTHERLGGQRGNVWLARAKESDTVYALVTKTPWPYRTRRAIRLRSVRATEETEVEILGQSGEVIEYEPGRDPKAKWQQGEKELVIEATRAQRIYNDGTWANPVVIRITHARAAD